MLVPLVKAASEATAYVTAWAQASQKATVLASMARGSLAEMAWTSMARGSLAAMASVSMVWATAVASPAGPGPALAAWAPPVQAEKARAAVV
jgi:hypothetical protein